VVCDAEDDVDPEEVGVGDVNEEDVDFDGEGDAIAFNKDGKVVAASSGEALGDEVLRDEEVDVISKI
jgi:hypothetical protein